MAFLESLQCWEWQDDDIPQVPCQGRPHLIMMLTTKIYRCVIRLIFPGYHSIGKHEEETVTGFMINIRIFGRTLSPMAFETVQRYFNPFVSLKLQGMKKLAFFVLYITFHLSELCKERYTRLLESLHLRGRSKLCLRQCVFWPEALDLTWAPCVLGVQRPKA